MRFICCEIKSVYWYDQRRDVLLLVRVGTVGVGNRTSALEVSQWSSSKAQVEYFIIKTGGNS